MTPVLGAKPLASLSSGLLARKGQARPAMKSQGFVGFGPSTAAALDDLGWNDMGLAETAAPVRPALAPAPVEPAEPAPPPPVLALRDALIERLEVEPPAPAVEAAPSADGRAEPVNTRPVSVATAARIGRESAKQTKTGKAAFTLRLDCDRHLKVRLASALAGRSAQRLVTEAVDAFLQGMPEVDALVAQLPEPKGR